MAIWYNNIYTLFHVIYLSTILLPNLVYLLSKPFGTKKHYRVLGVNTTYISYHCFWGSLLS